MNVQTIPSSTTVCVEDSNNITVNMQGGNQINLQVDCPPQQTIRIDRGVQGAPGNNGIYGSFIDTTTQTNNNITQAKYLQFNTTVENDGVVIENDINALPTKVVFYEAGIYTITFSIQFANLNNQIHDTDIWLVKNGTQVAQSNSKFAIPNSHGGVYGHLIGTINYVLTLEANDYLQFGWSVDNTQIQVEAIPVQLNPTRPATPSIILTAIQTAI